MMHNVANDVSKDRPATCAQIKPCHKMLKISLKVAERNSKISKSLLGFLKNFQKVAHDFIKNVGLKLLQNAPKLLILLNYLESVIALNVGIF